MNDPPLDHSPLPKDTFYALRQLDAFLQSKICDVDSRAAYSRATRELLISAKLMAHAGVHLECGMVIYWPYILSEATMADARALNPYALVLFAYLGVLCNIMGERYWFLAGWGKALVSDIQRPSSPRTSDLKLGAH